MIKKVLIILLILLLFGCAKKENMSEQEIEELYSPDNFDFDATQKMIVAERPVSEVNVKVELFPL